MTKKNCWVILSCLVSFQLFAQVNTTPIVENFSSSNRVRSGIAIGGIGTGSVELRKDGNFYNWSIFKNYPYGAGPVFELPNMPKTFEDEALLFFLVRFQVEGEKPQIKLLNLNNSLQEAGMESIVYYFPWMSSVEQISYSARFPFTYLTFNDSQMPFTIEMEAFSPFIPHDVKNSSLPGAYFNFKITSKTNKIVDVMLLGSLRNLVGYDNIEKRFESKIIKTDRYKFFISSASGLPENSPTSGEMGLGAIGGEEISYYLGWEHRHPYYEKLLLSDKLPNIDDTQNRNAKTTDGHLVGGFSTGNSNNQRCFSSMAVTKKLEANSQFKTSFILNWNFPNNYGAVRKESNKSLAARKNQSYTVPLKTTKIVGHYYQNFFNGIDSIASYFVNNQLVLSERSHKFQDDMYSSDIDRYVLDQINSHLNTFITSTTLTKEGQFGIREGLTPSESWGPNSTMDVGLYGSQMIIALFPELQKSMMKTHKNLQTTDGEVNHGLGYDLDYNQNGTFGVYDRVDLVPDYIQMVLRDYLYTNDKKYLQEMWPSITKGINYILTKRDKNGDLMPDMNGIMCSYDNFPMYGLASYLQSQWIATLTMASQVALDMGDKVLSRKYSEIARKGSDLMETKLWNGSYYNLYNDYLGNKGIDKGCLTDQLIGQWIAHNTGLGYIFKKENVQKSLQSIMQKSFYNNSFLRNCSWPEYPDLYPIASSNLWVDQANTPWSGVELAFASFLIYENDVNDALKVIKAVDDRYRNSNLYFDHQEFGGHYYRPMAAWSILNAFLGYSVNRGVYRFDPKIEKYEFKLFFATPEGTAIYKKEAKSISIDVKSGKLVASGFLFQNSGITSTNPSVFIDNFPQKKIKIIVSKNIISISFTSMITLNEGSKIELRE